MSWTPADLTDILADLRRDEGCRLDAYQDSLGVWTVGYGHTGPAVCPGLCWTQAAADAQLAEDVADTADRLARSLPWIATLDPVRQAVLVELAFNMGVMGLMAFRNTLAAVERGNYAVAASGMLASLWADQVGPRANRLAAMMETGVRA